jgi:hypothetical protein
MYTRKDFREQFMYPFIDRYRMMCHSLAGAFTDTYEMMEHINRTVEAYIPEFGKLVHADAIAELTGIYVDNGMHIRLPLINVTGNDECRGHGMRGIALTFNKESTNELANAICMFWPADMLVVTGTECHVYINRSLFTGNRMVQAHDPVTCRELLIYSDSGRLIPGIERI